MTLSFGQELKRIAEEKGFTSQEQLAKAAGVSQPMVGKLFLDQRPNVSARVLLKLCDTLGVEVGHFRPFLAEEPTAKPKRKK